MGISRSRGRSSAGNVPGTGLGLSRGGKAAELALGLQTPPHRATVPVSQCRCHPVSVTLSASPCHPGHKHKQDAKERLKSFSLSSASAFPAFPLQPDPHLSRKPLQNCSHGNQARNKQTQQLLFFFLIQTTSERSLSPQIYDS